MGKHLLEIHNLRTCFHTERGLLPAVDGVSLHIDEGEILGLVGESGCGKSITSMSILQLVPKPAGEIMGGEILFEGADLLKLGPKEICRVRGNQISMIFQEPMTSLNPTMTCGRQITEALHLHEKRSKKEAMARAVELLRLAGIPNPEQRVKEYPHQLSGGMRQRVMIALALACSPKLLIADEPTTALDVTIQAQILDLIKQIRDEFGMSILLITHELGIVAETADRVIVMYAGKIVEEAKVRPFFAKPLHPYTADLLCSIPRLDERQERLHVIEGSVPNLIDKPEGCRYHTRCHEACDRCRRQEPPLFKVEGERHVACWKYADIAEKEAQQHGEF
ncbi:ABC transporter ATP-binding protein [Anaerotruncus sp. AF02-27]|uniref:ABC transporter ATP-binding protein n=1 Tax=Anaerotruncus TaxID=244127 RepID=UPI000E53E237|nr:MULTISPECIES: ABC transporter ATP-binding protein [Anaerotruncus]RGX56182.1 ABC transporter ATP-binding protein [Anaerotruncus sp. AF02-27]